MIGGWLAYLGPGSGLAGLALLGAIGLAILLLLVGCVFYPLRSLVRKWRAPHRSTPGGPPGKGGTKSTPSDDGPAATPP